MLARSEFSKRLKRILEHTSDRIEGDTLK